MRELGQKMMKNYLIINPISENLPFLFTGKTRKIHELVDVLSERIATPPDLFETDLAEYHQQNLHLQYVSQFVYSEEYLNCMAVR